MTELRIYDPDLSTIEIASYEQVMDLDHARLVVDEIRRRAGAFVEQSAQLQADAEDLTELIVTAYRGQAWLALGYESWEELQAAEFSQARLWESVESRRAQVARFIEEGLSTRAIGSVLGISKATAHRDSLAGVSHETPARPLTAVNPGDSWHGEPSGLVSEDSSGWTGDAESAPELRAVQGLDGKQYRRPTPTDLVDRGLRVAELAAQGMTQAEIGERMGTSQRTISSDLQRVEQWKELLDEASRQRLEQGRISRDEIAQRTGLEIVDPTGPRLLRAAETGTRGLLESVEFLETSVLEATDWTAERPVLSEPLGRTLPAVVNALAAWMGQDVQWDVLPADEAEGALALLDDARHYLDLAASKIDPHAQGVAGDES
ncbi:helix-turn-helix transcriptional regulator [Brachybacterium huguangmaarense]